MSHPKSWASGVASALLGAVAWGFSGTCVQYLFTATALDPLLLTTIRQLGAGLLFLAALALVRRRELRDLLSDASSRRQLAVFGTLGLFLNSTVYAAAVMYTNAGTATVLQGLSIVFALVVSCVAARRRPRRPELAALACALAATYLIATHGNPSTLSLPLEGLVLGVATAVAATFYTMYPARLFERWGSFAVTGIGMLVGGLCGLAVCLATDRLQGWPALDAASVSVLTVAVLVGTFGAYALFLHGISLVGPVWGNMLGAAEPLSATIIAAAWLNTPFTWADWAGLALMLATIALVALSAQPRGKAESRGRSRSS